jgi:tRNA wybutosine-synthesizing protein 1
MTLVKGYNMESVDGYAEFVERAEPTYIEAKAYMHVGFSGLRLDYSNMPSHKEVYDFAGRLAERTEYMIINEAAESRVVLLSKRRKPIRFETS